MSEGVSPAEGRVAVGADDLNLPEAVVARLPRPLTLLPALMALDARAQATLRHWCGVVAVSSPELAAALAAHAPRAFALLELPAFEAWVLKALDAFDHFGISAGLAVFEHLEQWAATRARPPGCPFEQVATLLGHVVKGLGGRSLQIASEAHAYTDTEKIFLPPALDIFEAREENAVLYKCLAAFLWAQNRYGTWRFRVLEAATRALDHTDGWPLYQRLESLRLLACLARDLPGLRREMDRVGYADAAARLAWDALRARAATLEDPAATAEDSLALVPILRGMTLPPPLQFQGEMFPAKVREALYKRVPREKAALQHSLNALQRELELQEPDDREDQSARDTPIGFRWRMAKMMAGASTCTSCASMTNACRWVRNWNLCWTASCRTWGISKTTISIRVPSATPIPPSANLPTIPARPRRVDPKCCCIPSGTISGSGFGRDSAP